MKTKDYSEAKWARLYKDYLLRRGRAEATYSLVEEQSFKGFKAIYSRIAEGSEGGIEKNKILKAIVDEEKKTKSYKQRSALVKSLNSLDLAAEEPEIGQFLKETGFWNGDQAAWATKNAYGFTELLEELEIKDFSKYFNS